MAGKGEPEESHPKPIGAALVLALPVVLSGMFYVWTHVAAVRLGYRLSQAAKTHQALLEENRGLRIEVSALKSPARLEKLAGERYGLAAPGPGQIHTLERR